VIAIRAGIMKGNAQPATKAVQSICQNSSRPSNKSVNRNNSFAMISDCPKINNFLLSTRSVTAPPIREAKIIGMAIIRFIYARAIASPVSSQARSERVSICPCIARKNDRFPKNNHRNCGILKTAKVLGCAGSERTSELLIFLLPVSSAEYSSIIELNRGGYSRFL